MSALCEQILFDWMAVFGQPYFKECSRINRLTKSIHLTGKP